MTRLLLVRHGQSTWNAESRWQGQADAPLSELGMRQAVAAAEGLARGNAISSIWSSDLARALRTAELLAEQLGIDVEVDRRLRERDAGEWTGLTRAEIEARYPGDLQARRSPSGFEPDGPLLERVVAALADIAAIEGGVTARAERGGLRPESAKAGEGREVLVVTHGGVVRTVERHLGAPAEPVPNLAGRWVELEDGGLRLGDRQLLIDPDDVAVTVPRSI
jgi:broad specificity phosphatase PhoE